MSVIKGLEQLFSKHHENVILRCHLKKYLKVLHGMTSNLKTSWPDKYFNIFAIQIQSNNKAALNPKFDKMGALSSSLWKCLENASHANK
jgi:hypothetical protein